MIQERGYKKVQRDLDYLYVYCYVLDYVDGRMF